MSHFRSNVRDVKFTLFDLLGLDHLLPADLDRDTVEAMIDEVDRLSRNVLADSYADGDRNPPVFDPETSSVRLPEPFRQAFRAYLDGGWWRLDVPEELGGTAAPRALWWALMELVQGANAPVFMYSAGPSMAGLLYRLGTPEQQRTARTMIEKSWAATMVLTEPEAGSDVGAGRTVARRQPDGSWHIEGVKRFITSGEHDLAENIVHFVLARPEGAAAGTKGLSMFVVPKFLFDRETGELLDRNGVHATNVERKMGIKVSTTCELTFGAKQPAVGWLVGDRHEGIAQMFKVIEGARMQVGVKAIATLSTGYLNARAYAAERVQGSDLTRRADPSAPRVTIDQHPDVRRMLMLQKCYAEGLRALYLFTAAQLDLGDPALNDLLLPLVKGVGSERSFEMLTLSLQTLGGSGFLQDHPMEQYLRDTKIDTLYEGTTGIQGQDLFFRKIARDRGAVLDRLLDRIDDPELAEAVAEVRAMTGMMLGWDDDARKDPAEVYRIGAHTTRLLLSLGDLLVGWLLRCQARLCEGREDGFARGKVAAAQFFTATVLPELAARRRIMERTGPELMEVPDDAF
ncbi:acyl-CoA dehydrogenase [Streptacidiphilus cavernicola]|uniref:Acyl-CoA dehydrogenase n=1 Tax=Streptacidiphilus cavernicola TaxID=3342716 RepID=A0ABV6VMV4_9ACTN